MLPLHVKNRMLNIAKRMSPIDSGNLRFNAIQGSNWLDRNNFTISYSETIAPYLEILQDSTWEGKPIQRRNIHKGFIDQTVLEIIRGLKLHYGGQGLKGRKEFGKVRDYQKNDEYSMQRRQNVYERSLEVAKLKKEASNNDSTAVFKEFI
jgi:hypothetical protein